MNKSVKVLTLEGFIRAVEGKYLIPASYWDRLVVFGSAPIRIEDQADGVLLDFGDEQIKVRPPSLTAS